MPACVATGGPVQVVLFNNQEAEMSQYHTYLSQYQTAMGRIERLAALLNAGQAVILNAGIMAALVAAVTLSPGGVTAGDIVLIHGFLLQLWGPLQFLGWFFRRAPAVPALHSRCSALTVRLQALPACPAAPSAPQRAHVAYLTPRRSLKTVTRLSDGLADLL